MHARVTRLQFPAARIDEVTKTFRDETVPAARKLPGFLGAVLLVNRENGEAAGITQWESREALTASDEAGTQLRNRAAESGGGKVINVERFELALMERNGPPRAGTAVRVTRGRAAEGKLDGLVEAVRNEAVPTMRRLSGFLALIVGIDRDSGNFAINSVFASAKEREDSNAGIDELRRRIFAAAGVENLEVLLYESTVVDMPVLADRS